MCEAWGSYWCRPSAGLRTPACPTISRRRWTISGMIAKKPLFTPIRDLLIGKRPVPFYNADLSLSLSRSLARSRSRSRSLARSRSLSYSLIFAYFSAHYNADLKHFIVFLITQPGGPSQVCVCLCLPVCLSVSVSVCVTRRVKHTKYRECLLIFTQLLSRRPSLRRVP